jgi:hypothetical protein
LSRQLKSGHASNANGRTKSSDQHRSIQPIIIEPKAPRFLKSLKEKLADFRLPKGTRDSARAACAVWLTGNPARPNLLSSDSAPQCD